LTISADTYFVEGTYSLTYQGETTACLPWNATSEEMTVALEALAWVDEVLIERTGGGSSPDYGYTYSVYFTGNGLHVQDDSSAAALSLIVPAYDDPVCTPLAYFSDGTKQIFGATEVSIEAARVRPRGFNLPTSNTTDAHLMEVMSTLPTFVDVYDVRRSLSDDRLGFKWTVVFDVSMGNAPPLVCGMDSTLSVNGICAHSTVTEGNTIGGHFIVATSKLLPSDVSAIDMANELQLLSGFGNVSVARTGPDNQGGFTWTVTWLTIEGDVPALSVTESLTGSDVSIVSATVVDGNYLGGTFKLSYDGYVTTALAYDAPAQTVQTALEAIVGAVSVVKGPPSSEGGSAYTVTFTALSGDIPLLTAEPALTGVGAVVKVLEQTKGSLALGSALKLSFRAPLQCSYSEVVVGSCGAPVDYYSIEVGDSLGNVAQIVTVAADYATQFVRIEAPSLFGSLYFVGEDVTGYFKLSYGAHVTGPISAHAGEQDVRDALEALPLVNTVSVVRSYSAQLLDATVTAIPGAQFLPIVPSVGADLLAGELIRVGGDWYRVAYSYDGVGALPLAKANDSSIVTFYDGAEGVTEIFRWARGFEWAVTFLSVEGDVMPLESPKHGINPLDAALSIRPADCLDCAFVSGLSPLTTYYLNIRAHNPKGFGVYQMVSGVPKEIPGAPNAISATSLSGTQLEVFFSPPSGVISDITQYTVQWDVSENFTDVTTLTPSCATAGYGSCELTGATISVVPPFQYLINFLTEGTRYYVRVAARNSVSLSNTIDTEDPTRWSEVVSAITANQAPSAPVAVSSSVSGPTSLQVLIAPPQG